MKKNFDQVICELTAENHQLTVALKEATLAAREAEAEIRSLRSRLEMYHMGSAKQGYYDPPVPGIFPTRWVSGT